MNILLLSLGLGALPNFLRPHATIGFVPTAGEPYEDPYFVNDDRIRLGKLGFSLVELDISNSEQDSLITAIRSVDAIFVAGGNTFYLMQQLKAKGIDKELCQLIRGGKPYIGASAGAAIVGPTLEPIRSLDDATAAPGLNSMDGLGIVDFVVLPHYGKPKYLDRYHKIVEDFRDKVKLVPLRDDKGLMVTAPDSFTEVESELVLHSS